VRDTPKPLAKDLLTLITLIEIRAKMDAAVGFHPGRPVEHID
jgi:hypothetical protein